MADQILTDQGAEHHQPERPRKEAQGQEDQDQGEQLSGQGARQAEQQHGHGGLGRDEQGVEQRGGGEEDEHVAGLAAHPDHGVDGKSGAAAEDGARQSGCGRGRRLTRPGNGQEEFLCLRAQCLQRGKVAAAEGARQHRQGEQAAQVFFEQGFQCVQRCDEELGQGDLARILEEEQTKEHGRRPPEAGRGVPGQGGPVGLRRREVVTGAEQDHAKQRADRHPGRQGQLPGEPLPLAECVAHPGGVGRRCRLRGRSLRRPGQDEQQQDQEHAHHPRHPLASQSPGSVQTWRRTCASSSGRITRQASTPSGKEP